MQSTKKEEANMKHPTLHRAGIVSFILLSRSFHSESTLAEGCPAPSFAAARSFDTGTTPVSVAIGDFNDDGKRDLAVADSGSLNLSVVLRNGDGTFQTAVNYGAGTNPESVSVGDFNGDGKPDLVVANNGSGTVSVLLGKGDGTFQAAI